MPDGALGRVRAALAHIPASWWEDDRFHREIEVLRNDVEAALAEARAAGAQEQAERLIARGQRWQAKHDGAVPWQVVLFIDDQAQATEADIQRGLELARQHGWSLATPPASPPGEATRE